MTTNSVAPGPHQRSAWYNVNNKNAKKLPLTSNSNSSNNINVTVSGMRLDTFIPTIPKVCLTNIAAKFKIKMLIPIKGRHTYKNKELKKRTRKERSRTFSAL